MAHSGKTITFATDLLPNEDKIYNLGTNNQRWKIYGELQPLETKTYENVIATLNTSNAVDQATGGFFYAKIYPTAFNVIWHTKFKVTVYVPGQNNYHAVSIYEVWGMADTYMSYKCQNAIRNTSYRPVYYNSLFRAKETGYNNNLGHWAGFSLLYSTNPNNTNYKRTVQVQLLEYDNCTVEMQDSLITPTNIPSRNTTNYVSTNTSYDNFDFCNNGLKETGDDTANDTDRTIQELYYFRYRTGAAGVGRYTLLMEESTGVYSSITTTFATKNDPTTRTNISMNTGVKYRLDRILYFNQNVDRAANTNIGNNAQYFTQYDLIDLRYTFKLTAGSLTAYQPFYMVGTLDDQGLFTIADADNAWTQTLPSSADGKVYIFLGMVYPDSSTYRIEFELQHPIYGFINDKLRKIQPGNATTANSWANARKVYVALGTASKTTTINGGASDAAAIALGIDGTLAIDHGGTGKTDANSAANALLSGLPTSWGATPLDDTTFIRSATDNASTFGRVKFSTLWTYIKNKADTTYAGINALAVANALVYKGVRAGAATTDDNAYGALTPAANCGDTYKVSVAGFINGLRVEVGDMLICTTDNTAAATASNYTTIRNNWNIIQTSEGSVSTSSTSSTDNAIVRWDGTSGRIIKSNNYTTLDDNGHISITHQTGVSTELQFKYSTTIDYWWGVGTGDINHGMYDNKTNKWIICAAADNKWNFDGNAATATAVNLTTTTNALAYYTNTTGSFGNASKITVYNDVDITVQNTAKKRNGLRLTGICYGNAASDLTSNTVGVMRYEDGGIRIEFSAGTNNGDDAALLYTNHDSANTGGGASFHFVGQKGSNDTGGDLAVTAPDFVARRRMAVGYNFTDTNYALKVNGASYLGGPLKIGAPDTAANTGYATANVGSQNYIAFYGVYNDNPGGFNHTYIGESIYGSKTTVNEQSELLLFHGNDSGTGSGPDRIRLLAGQIDLCVYTAATSGTWDTIRQTAGTRVANFANGQITITGNLLPEATDSRTLGTSTYRWKELYMEAQGTAASNGIMFYSSSTLYGRIGCNNSAGIGIYGYSRLLFRPSLTNTTIGMELTSTALYPTTTTTIDLGSTSNKWASIYATTYYGAINQQSSTGDLDRPVWFCYKTSTNYDLGIPGYNTNFMYNPSTGKLQVGGTSTGNIWCGTATASTAGTGERDIGVKNGSGRLYLYAAAETNGNKGLYSYAADQSTGGAIITVNQSNQISGIATITGTLTLSKTTDASGTANNGPALIVGGAVTSTHLELDANEIMAKATGTTTADIYINNDGNAIFLGKASNGTNDYTKVQSTADASATSNGALRVAGGVGIAKKLYVGAKTTTDTLTITNTTQTSHLTLSTNGDNFITMPNNAAAKVAIAVNTNLGTEANSKLVICQTGVVRPGSTNTQTLGDSLYRWQKVYVGTDNTYGNAYTPVYWNEGVPAPVSVVRMIEWTFDSGSTGTTLSSDSFTTNTIVIQIVVHTNESNLTGPINWQSNDRAIILSTTATSGTVGGYIIVAEGLVDSSITSNSITPTSNTVQYPLANGVEF